MRHVRFITPHVSRNFKSSLQNPKSATNSHHLTRISARDYCTPSQEPSEKVASIVEEISCLSLVEVMDLTDVVRNKLGIKEMPNMCMMMPGMGFSVKGATARGGSGTGKAEEKVEKTVFDLKLEGYGAEAKLKVIKEVRGFTGLGLKESKELVEKVPTLLKRGVTKDEAENIVAKLKEVGAQVSME